MVTPGMSFYHTTGDVAETIDYNVMLDSAELLAQVLWDVGNDTAVYPYEGPQPLDAQAGNDVRALLEGVAESAEITRTSGSAWKASTNPLAGCAVSKGAGPPPR